MNKVSNKYPIDKFSFLDFLLAKKEVDKNFVPDIMELLSISKSTVYKRLENKGSFTPDQVFRIAEFYGISLDKFLKNRSQSLLFNFPALNTPIRSFKDFLQPIEINLTNLLALDNHQLDFISREIPIFHYFHFPELTAYKAFFWASIIWEFPEFKTKTKFEFNDIKGIDHHRKSIINNYTKIPSIEIWGLGKLDITIKQITYHLENDVFKDPKEALILCDQLQELMNHIQLMTINGKKSNLGEEPSEDSGDYTLYHSIISPSNNFLIAQSDHYNEVFTTYDNLNAISAPDASLLKYAQNWKSTLIKHADEISPNSRKSQFLFFNECKKQLDAFRNKILKYMEENKN